jgi:hypothetical protein
MVLPSDVMKQAAMFPKLHVIASESKDGNATAAAAQRCRMCCVA